MKPKIVKIGDKYRIKIRDIMGDSSFMRDEDLMSLISSNFVSKIVQFNSHEEALVGLKMYMEHIKFTKSMSCVGSITILGN